MVSFHFRIVDMSMSYDEVFFRICGNLKLNSVSLHRTAFNFYSAGQRGSFVLQLNSISDAMTKSFVKHVIVWLPKSELIRQGRGDQIKLDTVNSYDPNTTFVVILHVAVGGHRGKMSDGSVPCISAIMQIHKDDHLQFNDSEHILVGSNTNAKWAPVCGNEGCDAEKGLRYCKQCQDIRYCSLDCQKEDWHSHKKVCSKTKTIRETARELAIKQE